MKRVAIVGGGVSGLAAAYYLRDADVECTLFEARSRLGGLIKTERLDGCLAEAGPDSWVAEKTWMLDLVNELGLGEQVIGSNDQRRRTYVVHKGRLVALPKSLRMLVPTKPWQILTTRSLGIGTKLIAAFEWFRKPSRRPERPADDFIREHLGSAAVERLAIPVLTGVFGTHPHQLSANEVLPQLIEYERRYGSILRGAYKNRRRQHEGPLFLTLRDGMETLVDALAQAVKDRCKIVHAGVQTVARSKGGWKLRWNGGSARADALVLATPAYEAALLLSEAAPDLAGWINTFSSSSTVITALTYPSAGFGHPLNGFGLLAPHREQEWVKACTWVGSKFDGRCPADKVLLRAFGTGESAHRAMHTPDAELEDATDAELRRWMGFQPAFTASRTWRLKSAMPLYQVGHANLVKRVEAGRQKLPALHLAGNSYGGVGIPDCVMRSQRIAHEVATR